MKISAFIFSPKKLCLKRNYGYLGILYLFKNKIGGLTRNYQ